MAEIKCPMDKPICESACAWYMNGKCAVAVIAKNLADAADGIGALKRTHEKKAGK